MASYSGTDFNDLAKLLFSSISNLSPDFNPLAYLDKFESMKTDLEKINFVHEDIKKYPTVFAKFLIDNKDDELAQKHSDSGQRKLKSGKYWEALEDFTRAVSTAKDEKMLALAYGYRSECFFKLNMFDKCLEEIARALPCYPKELAQNVLDLKQRAESKLKDSPVNKYYEEISNHNNCDGCTKIHYDDNFGKRIVASRDIEIGEILSIEEPFASVLTCDRSTHCHDCLKLCYNPIPCSNCTVALFCSEICRNKARSYHKYECPILLTICYRILCEFATDSSILLALKISLLVAECYPEKQMLHLRESHSHTGSYAEVHFLKSQATFSRFDSFHQAILTAIVFELLWNYTSFFSGIFVSVDSKDRFKEIMLLQLQTSCINAAKIYEYVHKCDFNGTNNFGLGAYSAFSLFNHSCCANVMKAYHGNTMVLRALNTIKKGEQCFVNRYGLRYDVSSKFDRQQFLFNQNLPQCTCRACQEDWNASLGDVRNICGSLNVDVMELGDIVRKVIGSDVDKATELLPNLIMQLKVCEELEPKGNALALKSLIAHCYVISGNKKIEFDDSQKNVVFVF